MSIYIAKAFKKMASGKRLIYFVLRQNVWDHTEKRQRTKYIAYVGKQPVLSLEKAREIADKLGIELEELARVRRLEIAGCDVADRIAEETPFGTVAKT